MELSIKNIENSIFTINGCHVMIDRDLAEMYQVETKVLNQAVKRNIERFPEAFMFQLNEFQKNELVTNCDRFKSLKHSSSMPYAFTEQGVAMLSAVLRSDVAVQVSIQIIQTFVAMRKTLSNLHGVIQRLETVELKQLQTDNAIEKILKAWEKDEMPKQGIFFEGQLFDAYVFVSNLIKKAKLSLILVDNYVNENTLHVLSKRKAKTSCTIHTRMNATLKLDLAKHNEQYPEITMLENKASHDRFLLIDEKELYHFGASLKDLGNKCFAFSRMDELLPDLNEKLLKNRKTK
jgi:hypothetical protein